MAAEPERGTPYDAVPYEGTALADAHPDRLAVVAALMGLEPPPVAGARVLELGCASGENLIPMAYALPGARFVGVDASARQVEAGRAEVEALGLGNVELRAGDLAELGDEVGTFDYVLCHGVYSWVPGPTRAAILDLCARRLGPDGIAYVSYNTYPGWHFAAIVRDLMGFAAGEADGPAERVRRAREALDVVERSLPEPEGLYGRVFRDEAARVRGRADSYLLHEHLEAINEPVHFRDFAAAARRHGLRHVADARFGMNAAVQPPGLRGALAALAGDADGREQAFDFLRNRRFRRSVLCRADRAPREEPDAGAVAGLRVEALALPESAEPDASNEGPEGFRRTQGGGRVMVADPPAKALLGLLAEAAPRALPFGTLRSLIDGRLARAGREPLAEGVAARLVLDAYVAGLVDLHAFEPRLADRPGDRPEAAAPARRQAGAGRPIVSQRHRVALLGDFDRQVVRRLDGRRDRDALIRDLVATVVSGAFPIRDTSGRAIAEPEVVASLLERSIEPSLLRIAAAGLLVGDGAADPPGR